MFQYFMNVVELRISSDLMKQVKILFLGMINLCNFPGKK